MMFLRQIWQTVVEAGNRGAEVSAFTISLFSCTFQARSSFSSSRMIHPVSWPTVLAWRIDPSLAGGLVSGLQFPPLPSPTLLRLQWNKSSQGSRGWPSPKVTEDQRLCPSVQLVLSTPLGNTVCAKSFQLCPTLRPYGLKPTRLLCPWDSPGKNTGVGCPALLQGIFPT